jgi:hypothetical protein
MYAPPAYIRAGRDPSNTSRDSKSFLLSNTNHMGRRVLHNSRGLNLSNPSCCLHHHVLELGIFPRSSIYLRVSLSRRDGKTPTVPADESGKIARQTEAPVENVSMVSTGWGNPSRTTSRTNRAGSCNPPRNDSWDGLVATTQEDPRAPMISCSIYDLY